MDHYNQRQYFYPYEGIAEKYNSKLEYRRPTDYELYLKIAHTRDNVKYRDPLHYDRRNNLGVVYEQAKKI